MSYPVTPLDLLKQQAWKHRPARNARAGARRAVHIEGLERRQLFAASIDGRVLTGLGGGGDDVITVTRIGADDVSVSLNGAVSVFDLNDFDSVVVSGVGGDDVITVGDGINNVSLVGGSGDDQLTDGNGNNTLIGGDGDDTLVAGAGNDFLSGGDGQDTVDYSARTTAFTFDLDTTESPAEAKATAAGETDTFATFEPLPEDERDVPDLEVYIGGQQADSFRMVRNIHGGFNPHYVFDGRGGNDTFTVDGYLSSITYTALGGDGNDLFRILTNTNSTTIGGAGDDVFQVGEDSSPEAVDGGAGTDLITFDSINTPSVVDLNDFTDVENAVSARLDVLIIGTPGDNHLTTGNGGTIRGGAGNDTLIGGHEDDQGVSLHGEEGDDSIVGDGGDDTLDGGDGNDSLVGLDGADRLDGGNGTDTLVGGFGADVLLNGEVNDQGTTIDGLTLNEDGVLRFEGTHVDEQVSIWQDGDNLVIWVDGVTDMIAAADVTFIVLDGGDGNDLLKLHKNLAIRSALLGGEGNDKLIGGAANDGLSGGEGNDHMTGNGGNDLLSGEGGADTMLGSSGKDTVNYESRFANLIVGLDSFADDGEAGENDLAYLDIERVLGGRGNDRIGGSAGNNELYGGAGNDTIGGGGGADALFGAGGNDKLDGGDDDDYLEGGAGHDRVYGGAGRDTLTGQAGNDKLFSDGDDEADLVSGGLGSDTGDVDDEDELTSIETVV